MLNARQSEEDENMMKTRLDRQAGTEEIHILTILGCTIVGDGEKLVGGHTEFTLFE